MPQGITMNEHVQLKILTQPLKANYTYETKIINLFSKSNISILFLIFGSKMIVTQFDLKVLAQEHL